MLLLVTEDEDVTLGMLLAIAQDLFPDYYTPTMLGYQVDQRVLEDLLEEKLPQVHQVQFHSFSFSFLFLFFYSVS